MEKPGTATERKSTDRQGVTSPRSEEQVIRAVALLESSEIMLLPGDNERQWMNRTPHRFAYRCLPMLIANQHGWVLHNPMRFEVEWSGGNSVEDLTIAVPDSRSHPLAVSRWGQGVFSLIVPFAFSFPPDFFLRVRGVPNLPRDGIYPLDGLLASESEPSVPIMNWQVTAPGTRIVFDVGEPLCMILPERETGFADFDPEILDLRENAELHRSFRAFSDGRKKFYQDQWDHSRSIDPKKWQKHYFRGRFQDEVPFLEHQTKLRVRSFVSTEGDSST